MNFQPSIRQVVPILTDSRGTNQKYLVNNGDLFMVKPTSKPKEGSTKISGLAPRSYLDCSSVIGSEVSKGPMMTKLAIIQKQIYVFSAAAAGAVSLKVAGIAKVSVTSLVR